MIMSQKWVSMVVDADIHATIKGIADGSPLTIGGLTNMLLIDGLEGLAVRRFEREAQVTASLSSPHTINLYDFGTTDDGTFYYVMELLDGIDFQTLVDTYGPLPANRAVHLLTQTSESLAEAHERELTHRDIKPANLFICRAGTKTDFVKVLDFGLVRSADDSESGSTRTT